jgi:hypothetical protein
MGCGRATRPAGEHPRTGAAVTAGPDHPACSCSAACEQLSRGGRSCRSTGCDGHCAGPEPEARSEPATAFASSGAQTSPPTAQTPGAASGQQLGPSGRRSSSSRGRGPPADTMAQPPTLADTSQTCTAQSLRCRSGGHDEQGCRSPVSPSPPVSSQPGRSSGGPGADPRAAGCSGGPAPPSPTDPHDSSRPSSNTAHHRRPARLKGGGGSRGACGVRLLSATWLLRALVALLAGPWGLPGGLGPRPAAGSFLTGTDFPFESCKQVRSPRAGAAAHPPPSFASSGCEAAARPCPSPPVAVRARSPPAKEPHARPAHARVCVHITQPPRSHGRGATLCRAVRHVCFVSYDRSNVTRRTMPRCTRTRRARRATAPRCACKCTHCPPASRAAFAAATHPS